MIVEQNMTPWTSVNLTNKLEAVENEIGKWVTVFNEKSAVIYTKLNSIAGAPVIHGVQGISGKHGREEVTFIEGFRA
jgi:hypothetical protein